MSASLWQLDLRPQLRPQLQPQLQAPTAASTSDLSSDLRPRSSDQLRLQLSTTLQMQRHNSRSDKGNLQAAQCLLKVEKPNEEIATRTRRANLKAETRRRSSFDAKQSKLGSRDVIEKLSRRRRSKAKLEADAKKFRREAKANFGSNGTQSNLNLGCALFGPETRPYFSRRNCFFASAFLAKARNLEEEVDQSAGKRCGVPNWGPWRFLEPVQVVDSVSGAPVCSCSYQFYWCRSDEAW